MTAATSATSAGAFSGKVAVVTGGARGIGERITARLAAHGATVVIADLDEAGAVATAGRLGGPVHGVGLDVTDSAAVRELVGRTVERFGGLHILVNNAGICDDSPTADLTDADWRGVMSVDLDGTFYCAREAGRHFLQAGGGAIVNVSSLAGYRAVQPEKHLAYDVAKAGVAHLTRVLAAEWALDGIRVNAVAPGYTDTEILRSVGATKPEVVEQWINRIPIRRFLDPTEIANVVAFLASDDASAVTGHVLVADGGYSAL